MASPARAVDERATAEDETARREAGLLLDILTPIMKAWASEWCLEANKLAIQVHGGYGYTREYPVEQYYRDARLNPIHEGTNGVQALDLLGRKVAMEDGAAFALLCREMGRTVAAARKAGLAEYADGLDRAIARASETTAALLAARGNIALALANASVYLDMLGHTVVAWMWLRQALAATEGGRGATGPERDFYDGKLAACRYFFRWELPKTEAQAALLQSLDDTCLAVRDAQL